MNKVTQTELDWFVEGEPDANERDELFARLDQEPNGWKRCALALLERDALRRSLNSIEITDVMTLTDSGLAESDLADSDSAIPFSIKSRDGKWPGGELVTGFQFRHALGIAVLFSGLLLAIQYWQSGDRYQLPIEGPPVVAESENNKADKELADGKHVPWESAMREPGFMLAVDEAISSAGVKDGKIVALVSLEFRDDQVLIPLIESPALERQLTDMPPVVLPTGLSRKLARSGYRVKPNRQFISVSHEDGSNEVMSMNMLDCQYVGKSTF